MNIKKHFNLQYIRVSLAFLAFSGIAAGFLFVSSLDKYAPQTEDETSQEVTVEAVTFGYSEDGAHEKTEKFQPGEFCYIKVDGWDELLRYPGITCELEVGQTVNLFVDENDSARLSPENFELAKTALIGYTYFGFGLGILALVGFIFASLKLKRNRLKAEEL